MANVDFTREELDGSSDGDHDDERSEEGQNALSGTFTVGEDRQTVTFTTTEGAEVSFTVVDVEGVDNQIDVTLNDTVIRLSLVDMNTLK